MGVALGCLAFAACGDDDGDDAAATTAAGGAATETTSTAEQATVRMIRYAPANYDWCLLSALDQGFFEDEGITIPGDPLQVSTDADLNRALIAGEGDVALGTIGLFQSYSEGSEPPAAIIGGSGMAGYGIVGPAEGGTGIEALEGGTVAVSPEGQPSGIIARSVLDDALGEGGYTPLHLGGGSSARVAAVEAGQADGALLASPFDEVAVQGNPALQIIGYLDSEGPRYEVGVILARREWLDDNVDVAVRWMRGYLNGSCDIYRHVVFERCGQRAR